MLWPSESGIQKLCQKILLVRRWLLVSDVQYSLETVVIYKPLTMSAESGLDIMWCCSFIHMTHMQGLSMSDVFSHTEILCWVQARAGAWVEHAGSMTCLFVCRYMMYLQSNILANISRGEYEVVSLHVLRSTRVRLMYFRPDNNNINPLAPCDFPGRWPVTHRLSHTLNFRLESRQVKVYVNLLRCLQVLICFYVNVSHSISWKKKVSTTLLSITLYHNKTCSSAAKKVCKQRYLSAGFG